MGPDNGRRPNAHRMSRSSARKRNIKHHDDKAECADHRQQRHQPRVEQPLTRANATYQNGIAIPYKTAQVEGLR